MVYSADSFVRQISEALQGGTLSLNREGIIVLASQEFLSHIGDEKSTVIGKPITHFLELESPEEFASNFDLLFHSRSFPFKVSCLWRSGARSISMLLNFFSPEPNGEIVGVFTQIIDNGKMLPPKISYIEQILENIGAVIFLIGQTPEETFYISPSFEKFYELSLEQYLREPTLYLERVHPEDLKDLLKIYDKDSALSVRVGHFRYLLKDGGFRHVSFYRFPVYDERGNVRKYAGVVINTTELYTVQTNLQQERKNLIKANEQLKRMNEEIEELTAFACHDLSEPLRAFSFFMYLLEESLSDKEQIDNDRMDILSHMRKASHRMQELIKGITSLSLKLEAVSEIPYLDIAKLIEKKHKVLYGDPSLPLCQIEHAALHPIRIQEEHMNVLIENLIGNSIKYNENFAKIKITSREFPSCIVYSFTDNGIGICKENHEYVFKMGRRLNVKPEQPGMGLGLAACRRMVTMYGGKIWVNSKPGKGATFYILFPKEEQLTNPLFEIHEDHSHEVDSRFKILLIEDNPHDIYLFRKVLDEYGQKVDLSVLTDGAEALHYFQKGEIGFYPSIIFLDLHLPNVGGLDILAYIKKSPAFQEIPVIVCTGSLNNDDISRSYKLKSSSVLKKSFDYDEYKRSIFETLDSHYSSPLKSSAKDPG